MFFLRKLATSLILPPGVFILILLFLAFFMRNKRIVFLIAIGSALFLYLISIVPVKDILISPLEQSFSVTEKLNADVIVILGGGSYNSGFLKEDSLNRLFTGYLLHKKTGLPIILSGGSSDKRLSDSQIMGKILREIGVDNSMIIEESRSRNTSENALYTLEICKKKGFSRLILVTSAYHMKRSVKIFQKTGLTIIPYPTDFKADRKYSIYSFLPQISSFTNSTKAIREYISLSVM